VFEIFDNPSWKGILYGNHGSSAARVASQFAHEVPFKNQAFVDFTKPEENVRRMHSALEKVRGQLGREYDLIIGGKRTQDRGQDPVDQSGETVGGRSASTRRPAKSTWNRR
jgi:hypothetical protein